MEFFQIMKRKHLIIVQNNNITWDLPSTYKVSPWPQSKLHYLFTPQVDVVQKQVYCLAESFAIIECAGESLKIFVSSQEINGKIA